MQASTISQIFTWRGFNFIAAPNEFPVQWKTHKFPLHNGEFAIRYEDPQQLLGVGFDGQTDYLMSDIDRHSPYHPANSWVGFRSVLRAMESIGLYGRVIVRSSDSGGLHVYFPLPKHVNTFNLAVAAKVSAIDKGLDVAPGKLEFFPNVKNCDAIYNRHRLPLQPDSGSILLDDDGNPAHVLPEAQHAHFRNESIIAAAEQDTRLLERKMRQFRAKWNNPKNYRKYRLDRIKAATLEYRSIEAEQFDRSLDRAIEIGFTGCDQTQQIVVTALKKVIIFMRLQGEEAIERIVEIVRGMPGFHRYSDHVRDIRKVAASWVRSCERRDYYLAYCAHPSREIALMARQGSPNNPAYGRSAQAAIERIRQAVAALPQLPNLYKSIESLMAAIQSKTKELFNSIVSRTTLGKHKSVWHPRHDNAGSIGLPETFCTRPEPNPSANPSDLDRSDIYKTETAKTSLQPDFDRSEFSILCGASVPDKSLLGRNDLPIDKSLTRQRGKFELLSGMLIKIALITAMNVEPESVLETASEIVSSPSVSIGQHLETADDGLEVRIEIGSILRRNSIKLPGGRTLPPLDNCEAIGSRGLDWKVRTPDKKIYNVSASAIASGHWEVVGGERSSTESDSPLLDLGFQIGDRVETAVGAGTIVRIYKYSSYPYAVDIAGAIYRSDGADLGRLKT